MGSAFGGRGTSLVEGESPWLKRDIVGGRWTSLVEGAGTSLVKPWISLDCRTL